MFRWNPLNLWRCNMGNNLNIWEVVKDTYDYESQVYLAKMKCGHEVLQVWHKWGFRAAAEYRSVAEPHEQEHECPCGEALNYFHEVECTNVTKPTELAI